MILNVFRFSTNDYFINYIAFIPFCTFFLKFASSQFTSDLAHLARRSLSGPPTRRGRLGPQRRDLDRSTWSQRGADGVPRMDENGGKATENTAPGLSGLHTRTPHRRIQRHRNPLAAGETSLAYDTEELPDVQGGVQ